ADAAFQDIWPFVGHPDPALRRSAIFSMALLESDRAAPVLLSLLNNTSKADNVSCAMAAISLGYLSAPQAVTRLMQIAAGEADLELRRAAVVALGLFSSSQREIVVFLLEQLDRRSVPEEVRTAIPIALARLGDDAAPAVPALRKLVHGTRTREALRRSSVIALGRLAPPDDIDSMETLIRTVLADSDGVARGLALISIGEIAARGNPSDGLSAEARERGNQLLCRVVAGEAARENRAWACLAGARSHREGGCPPAECEALATDLLKIIHYSKESSLRAAAVLALGILDAQPAADTLLSVLQDREAPLEASFAALALGLLGDKKDLGPIRSLVSRSSDPDGRDRAVTGLALISREDAGDLLVRMLSQTTTTAETVWAARTLGQVGTPSSIPHLVRLAADKESPSLSRAFALVGLGRLLEPTRLPWNVRLATGANYLSLGQAETALLDIY
ncbi:MAG: HEAT repeat domain-containing protein, partial [Planctomycetota bacterium]